MIQSLSCYRIFYTVAKTGNISKAAKELYISQPAISKSIQKLEDNLGCELFRRSSRGVLLTEEGELLYTHVSSALETLALGEDKLKNSLELGVGHLKIGVSSTLCKYILLPYLKEFTKRYPHINISITCQSSNDTLQLLEANKIDVGLIGKPDHLKTLDFFYIEEIEDIFVASPAYLLDKNNMTRQYIDDYLQENQIAIRDSIEISSMDLLIDFAKINLGVGCVIREFVKNELADGTLIEIPLGFPMHKREIGFAYKKTLKPSKSLELFIQFYHHFNR